MQPQATGANRTKKLQDFLTIVSAIVWLVFLAMYVANLHLENHRWFDGDGYIVGIDFLNTWMMGHAGLYDADPGHHYNISEYNNYIRSNIHPDYPAIQWTYPPLLMLLGSMFAWLPYALALTAFWCISFMSLTWAIRQWDRVRWKRHAVAILASPSGYLAFTSGQVALLLVTLQLSFFRVLDRRPVLAGILLGMLTIKPNLGIIYPAFLISTRRWKTFFSAAITTLILLALSYGFWGFGLWDAYLHQGVPALNKYILADMPRSVSALIPSVFVDLRIVAVNYNLAMAVQSILSLIAMGFLFTGRFQRMDQSTQMLMVAIGSLLCTPYVMAYDMLFCVTALVLWLRHHPVDRLGYWLCVACYWLPLLHFIAIILGIPGFAIVPILLGIWVLRVAGNSPVKAGATEGFPQPGA